MGKSNNPTEEQFRKHLELNDFSPEETERAVKLLKSGMDWQEAKSAVRPVPTVDLKSWDQNHPAEAFIKQGLDPKAAMMAAHLQANGLDPKLAVAAVNGLGLNPTPDTRNPWLQWKDEHPIRGYAKERLQEIAPGAKAFARPFTESPMSLLVPRKPRDLPNQHDVEKLSAAKMLQDYLMHQDVIRAAEHQKDVMNRAASTPGIMDYLQGAVNPQPQLQVGQANVAPVTTSPMNIMAKPNG